MTDNVSSGFNLTRAVDRITPLRVQKTPENLEASKKTDSPEKIKKAAEQFEALLIGQMLKSAREAGGSGWMGTGEDKPGQTGTEMAEQQFASMLASKGGLGLTRFITTSLERKSG